jgi:hypothetical protein
MKRLFLLCLFVVAAITLSAQNYTLAAPGVTNIVDDTVASAGTDSRYVLLKIPDGNVWNFQLMLYYTQLSGTSEVWIDTYCSNDGSNWELAVARAAGDTLKNGNTVCLHEDNDGFPYRYFKVLYTAKTAIQSTRVRGYLYLTPYRY